MGGGASAGCPEAPPWPARLVDVLSLLRAHIPKEQDGVFPAALAARDSDQWERIEAVRAHLEVTPPALPKPALTSPALTATT